VWTPAIIKVQVAADRSAGLANAVVGIEINLGGDFALEERQEVVAVEMVFEGLVARLCIPQQ
jgi:hypothetical protein